MFSFLSRNVEAAISFYIQRTFLKQRKPPKPADISQTAGVFDHDKNKAAL